MSDQYSLYGRHRGTNSNVIKIPGINIPGASNLSQSRINESVYSYGTDNKRRKYDDEESYVDDQSANLRKFNFNPS